MQAGTDSELAAALAMSLDRPVDDAHAAEADSFSQMTGASPDKAAMWLAAHQGDVEAAVNAFFESGEDLPMPAPEAPLPRAQQIQAIRQGLVGGRWKCGSCTFVHEELEKQLLWCRVCNNYRVGPDVDLTTATPPFAMGDLTRVAELVSDLDEPEPEPPQNAGAGAAAAKEPDGEDDDGEAAMDWNIDDLFGSASDGEDDDRDATARQMVASFAISSAGSAGSAGSDTALMRRRNDQAELLQLEADGADRSELRRRMAQQAELRELRAAEDQAAAVAAAAAAAGAELAAAEAEAAAAAQRHAQQLAADAEAKLAAAAAHAEAEAVAAAHEAELLAMLEEEDGAAEPAKSKSQKKREKQLQQKKDGQAKQSGGGGGGGGGGDSPPESSHGEGPGPGAALSKGQKKRARQLRKKQEEQRLFQEKLAGLRETTGGGRGPGMAAAGGGGGSARVVEQAALRRALSEQSEREDEMVGLLAVLGLSECLPACMENEMDIGLSPSAPPPARVCFLLLPHAPRPFPLLPRLVCARAACWPPAPLPACPAASHPCCAALCVRPCLLPLRFRPALLSAAVLPSACPASATPLLVPTLPASPALCPPLSLCRALSVLLCLPPPVARAVHAACLLPALPCPVPALPSRPSLCPPSPRSMSSAVCAAAALRVLPACVPAPAPPAACPAWLCCSLPPCCASASSCCPLPLLSLACAACLVSPRSRVAALPPLLSCSSRLPPPASVSAALACPPLSRPQTHSHKQTPAEVVHSPLLVVVTVSCALLCRRAGAVHAGRPR